MCETNLKAYLSILLFLSVIESIFPGQTLCVNVYGTNNYSTILDSTCAGVKADTVTIWSPELNEPSTGFKDKAIYGDAKVAAKDRQEYAPEQIIFRLAGPDIQRSINPLQAQQLLQQVALKHKLIQTVPVFAKDMGEPLRHIYLAHLPAGVSPVEVCKQLQSDPAIKWVEPNYYYRCQLTPDDTYYSSTGSWGQEYRDMWGLHAINPENAWDQTQGDNIIVAVIDTGIDYNHEDLYRDLNTNGCLDPGEQYNVWINAGEDLNGNGVVDPNDFNGKDDDGNGFIDDIRGWNFIANSSNPTDDHGHGTHCAGIIAAVGNNSMGILGVAPLARIMVIKSLNKNGEGTATQLANGIIYAVNNGAHVLSNSWGGGGASQLITEAIEYARNQNRVVVVAAGNDGLNVALWSPANIRGVLTVAALEPSLKRASFSNFGSVVDFLAPGVDVLSLRAAGTDMYGDGKHFVPAGDLNAKYYRANGTSMACPFVSGVSALLLGQNPSLTETSVRRALAASAGPVGVTDVYVGTGLVDAEVALDIAEQVSDVNAAIDQPQDDLEPFATNKGLDILGTADGDSYLLEFGEGYYPNIWTTISTGTSVTNGLLGTLDLSDKQGPYHIRLTVSDGTQTAIEHTVFWAEPDLHPGWPVRLGGSVFRFGGFILGTSFNATPADADRDGSDEIFLCSSGNTFGLRGDGTILPGWPSTQLKEPAYASNAALPGPSVADVGNDGNVEILWTLRDYWPDYYGSPSTVWCFNGKKLDGSNMSSFPQQAIEEPSNAFNMPFVLADLDGNGTLEAVAAHTKGNNFNYYRISAFAHSGSRLFTHDFPDSNESVYSLSFGDIDADGQKDIVAVSKVGYESIRLHILDKNGSEQPGYPIVLRNLNNEDISAPPFLADLDADGDMEIVVGTSGSQSYIQCYHHDGRLVAGFPAPIGNYDTQIFSYSVGDINGDGRLEIIVLANYRLISGTYRVYVIRLNGTVLPGFPFDVQEWPTGAPAVVDVDNDGRQDICFTTFSGSVYACSGDGQLVPHFPKKMSFASTSGVSVGDVDGDGLFELITATMIGHVYVWDLPTPAEPGNTDWPMRHVNPLNTNVFGDRVLIRNNCDLNNDGTVDFADYAILTDQWLRPPAFPSADIAPLPAGDGVVNWLDLAEIAEHWLEDTTP
jgi:hypothetical protein